MSFIINVAKNGVPFFSIEKESLPNLNQASDVFMDMKARYPKDEGFEIKLAEIQERKVVLCTR